MAQTDSLAIQSPSCLADWSFCNRYGRLFAASQSLGRRDDSATLWQAAAITVSDRPTLKFSPAQGDCVHSAFGAPLNE